MSFQRYPAYRDSGVEWIGEVPAHWKIDRLKRSVRSERNGIWGGEPQGNADDLPCLRVADFDRNRLVAKTDNLTIRNVSAKEREGRLLRLNDLLIEKSGGGENQPVGCVVLFAENLEAVCSNFLARLELSQGMDPSFWRYLHAATYAGRINTRSIKQTSGIQNLDTQAYFNEPIPFPSFEEQTAIGSFLDRETAKIDALIAEQERLIALLQEKRQVVISHAVTKGLDPNVPMKDSGVAWLSLIPNGWPVIALRYLVDCLDKLRIPLNAEERAGREGNIPYWGANGVVDYLNEALLDETVVLLGEDGAPFLDRLKPKAFVSVGPIWPNNHIHVLRTGGKVTPEYLSHCLNLTDYAQFIEGSTREKLTQTRMMGIPIAVPPFEEQEAICAFVADKLTVFDNLGVSASEAIDLLRERRSALITAAVTGQIDVRGLVETAA